MKDVGATVLALTSPIVAIAIATWGYRRTYRADRIRTFFDLYQRYVTSEQRSGRRLLHDQVANRAAEELAALPQEVRDKIGATLSILNAIAIASEGGHVDFRMIADSMGRSYAGTMQAARAYIDHVELQRGYRPYPFAERMAARLAEHRIDRV